MATEPDTLSHLIELLMKGDLESSLGPTPSVAPPNTCSICHHFTPGLFTSTAPSDFLLSAKSCAGCSVVLKVLDAVTDLRKPEFTAIELERKETPRNSWDPKGVLKIHCVQKGRPDPANIIFRKYDNPFPNKYSVYTSLDAGEDAAIPWLGLRDGKDDDYKEMAENLDDRLCEARTWLQECFSEHRACDRRIDFEWPRRVLDIADECVRLVTSASLSQTQTEETRYYYYYYACLSYAWGTSENLKTLKENLESHMRGIGISSLPRTLSDAVYVCKAMGIRYLWIDALCIIQDDTQDWMDQIPKMSSIYQGAELVISAQAASNVHQGFLSLTTAKNAPFKRVELPFQLPNGTSRTVKLSIREDQHGGYFGIPAHHSHRPALANDVLVPLTTRAWVFQETFLARRILYATPSELAWQCSTCCRCECMPKQQQGLIMRAVENGEYDDLKTLPQVLRAQSLGADRLPPLARMNLWGEIVSQFSDKKITVWTDRLAAVQGVVEALVEAIPDTFKREEYLFGLWKPFLVRCMAWNRDPHEPGNATAVNLLKDIAPSWSWVTAIGKITYYGTLFDPEAIELVHVIDVKHYRTEASNTVFGAGGCTLYLCGHILSVMIDDEAVSEEKEDGIPFLLEYRFAAAPDDNAVIDMIADDPTDEGVFDRVTHFVPLIGFGGDKYSGFKVQGLFLEVVSETEEEYTFKRVGFGYDWGERVNLFYYDTEEFNKEMRFFRLV